MTRRLGHRRGSRSMRRAACCNASPRTFLASTAQKAVSRNPLRPLKRGAKAPLPLREVWGEEGIPSSALRAPSPREGAGSADSFQDLYGPPTTSQNPGHLASKVFFRLSDLPERCQQPGPARDAFPVGHRQPDPYGAHMGRRHGATSSTAKCVILPKASNPITMWDYLYGQVAIDKAPWTGAATAAILHRRRGLAIHRRPGGPVPHPGARHLVRCGSGRPISANHPRPRAGDKRPGAGDRRFLSRDGVTFPPPRSCGALSTRPTRVKTAAPSSPPAIWWTIWRYPRLL